MHTFLFYFDFVIYHFFKGIIDNFKIKPKNKTLSFFEIEDNNPIVGRHCARGK
jgi:hypothetical protein